MNPTPILLSSDEAIAEILGEYNSFYDSVVTRIEYELIDDDYELSVGILTKHRDSPVKARVSISLASPVEFVFREQNTCSTVLSQGMFVKRFGDILFVSFDPYRDDPDTIEEYRQSYFYAASHKVSLTRLADVDG